MKLQILFLVFFLKATAALAIGEIGDRKAYRDQFAAATTIQLIVDFELRYAQDDPDALIPLIAQLKSKLEGQAYLKEFSDLDSIGKISRFIRRYENNDPDGFVHKAEIRLIQLRHFEEVRIHDRIEKEIRDRAFLKIVQAESAISASEFYIRTIRDKFSKNITQSSWKAKAIVSEFEIDCRTEDKRVLPLINVLYAMMAEVAAMGGEKKIFLDNQSKQVRLYETIFVGGKPLAPANLIFEINEWNELRPVGIQIEALLNACFGSYGPIWRLRRTGI